MDAVRTSFLFLQASRFEDQLSPIDVGLDGLDGTFDDEFYAYSGGQMDDHIGIIDELGEQLAILDVVQVILHAPGGLEVPYVFHAAR